MSESLQGKQALLIAPRFFGYDQEIRAELERRGAKVDVLADRPFDTPFMTAVTRFRRDWVIGAATRLYKQSLETFGRTHYDLIFVVNGQTLSPEMLRFLRAAYPGARFVLYMWDSMDNRAAVLPNLPLFDRTLSFDRKSAQTYGMVFRPLFFSSGFEQTPVESDSHEYDLSFIGTAHTDRWAVASRVKRAVPAKTNCFFYLYLQAPWVYWAYRVTNPTMRQAPKSDFRFAPIAKSDVQSVFRRSLGILDIEHPSQTGLTIRTLETLGAQKKLVTTNQRIRDYDFYDASNVCCIDRHRPEIPADFLTTPYRASAPEIYRKYSIAGWMDETLED
ncbi:hypothetical protein [Pandoraea sputorum]|uniref:hypothetical protein n=1 Tax=Pandoraea sputorum TaxID=93222 RepID=UPI002AF6C573|nr:hypothetical protein [Pandoraea sputorum]